MREWVSQFRRGLLELCLLNLLSRGESYGYRIVQGLRAVEGLTVSESTVYPILARLLQEGHLRARIAPSSGGPERRYFALTAAGSRYAEELNLYWDSVSRAVRVLRKQSPLEKGASE